MKLLNALLLVAAAQFVAPLALACGDAGTGDPAAKCAAAGNPIDVISGNKFQREVDLTPLPGVMGLEVVRYYNSKLSSIDSRTGILGRGWRLSYETTLAAIGDTVQVMQADGTRLIFSRDLLNPSLCSGGDPANGEIDIRRTPKGDEYIWRKTNGQRLSFNSQGRLVQILAPTGEFVSMQHDARGWLVKVTDPQGRSLNLEYLGGKDAVDGTRFRGVQGIHTPVGRFRYAYGSEQPKGADPAERRQLVANLAQVETPDGGRRQYHYEDARFPTLLTGISVQGTNAQGKPAMQRYATYGYDSNAQAVLSTHAGNAGRITLDRSAGGQTTLTNSLGQKTVYRYSMLAGALRMQEVRGAGCAQCGETNVRYGYDAQGRMDSVTYLDRAGQPWRTDRTRYDHFGRPLEVRRSAYRMGKLDASRLLVRLEYAAGGGMQPSLVARPSVVPGREAVTSIRYNDAGQPLERIESGWAPALAAGQPQRITRATRMRYTRINQRSVLTEIDGPLPNGPAGSPADSDITRLQWNASGTQVASLTMPGNFSSHIEYDAAGRLSATKDETGAAVRMTLDGQGRITALSQGGVQHRVSFDAAGNMVEQGTGEGEDYRASQRYGYDAAGRNTWVASALGVLATIQYDTENRVVKSVRRSSRIVQEESVSYDDLGRPVAVDNGNGVRQEIEWDARDQPAVVRDALGRELALAYDLDGHLVRSTPAANATRLVLPGRSIAYEHDVNGAVSGVTAGSGAQTRYVRNDFGLTVAVISGDSGQASYRYDAAGRLEQHCEADGTCAAYVRDAAGRVTQRAIRSQAGVPATTTWRYQGRRLVGVDDGAQSERYAYDAGGALVNRTVTLYIAGGGAIASSTTYRYDAQRRLAAVSLPDGSELAYVRNGQGQVVALERSRIRTPWLRWLLPKQTIVSSLERDIVGLRQVRFGNGIDGHYLRAPSGHLARIMYRRQQDVLPRVAIAERLLGIGAAHAAAAAPGQRPAWDSDALLDRRYWWDVEGNLLYTRERNAGSAYAYDAQDRLVVAETRSAGAKEANVSRYFADGIGNRLLGLERGTTRASTYEARSSRLPGADASGRQTGGGNGTAEAAGRRYVWHAGGLLAEVWHGKQQLASYRYNYRGERIEKRSAAGIRYFLYEGRKLTAELDAQGRVQRQYIYLGNEPVAVLDTDVRADASALERGVFTQAAADVAAAWRERFGTPARIAFLHNNHLGATEAVTDEKGAVLWSAQYAPFGRLLPASRRAGFAMNLRLPGQFEDEETGLYYNDHRYYDPDAGRYISPDPLGLRGGINSYAYAGGNPLRFIDPSGLILFAFDGTGNTGPTPPEGDSISNVFKFFQAYEGANGFEKFYITGIGTTNEDMTYKGSLASGDGIDQRLALAFTFLDRAIPGSAETGALTLDIVGFSRGSATARAWINQLRGRMTNGAYQTGGKTRCIQFNFVGLWDTVPHLGLRHGDEKNYDLSIPAEITFVAHANALNEYRGGLDDFTAHSILQNAAAAEKPNRIERGFLGAHSDIGGSYGKGDLSDIALMWMIELARKNGLTLNMDMVTEEKWDVVTDAQLHDSSSNLIHGTEGGGPGEYGLDRNVIYADKSSVKQRKKDDTSVMTYADTVPFITYLPNPNKFDKISGTVDMKAYCSWLNSHDYILGDKICK